MLTLPSQICWVSIIHAFYWSRIDLCHPRAYFRRLHVMRKVRLQSLWVRFSWARLPPSSHLSNSFPPLQKTTQNKILGGVWQLQAWMRVLPGPHSVCQGTINARCLNEKWEAGQRTQATDRKPRLQAGLNQSLTSMGNPSSLVQTRKPYGETSSHFSLGWTSNVSIILCEFSRTEIKVCIRYLIYTHTYTYIPIPIHMYIYLCVSICMYVCVYSVLYI